PSFVVIVFKVLSCTSFILGTYQSFAVMPLTVIEARIPGKKDNPRRTKMWKGRGGVESRRQQPLDRGGNLYRLKLNALGSEMDIVAVIFGMSAHRQVKIVGGNVQRRHYCRRDDVSSV